MTRRTLLKLLTAVALGWGTPFREKPKPKTFAVPCWDAQIVTVKDWNWFEKDGPIIHIGGLRPWNKTDLYSVHLEFNQDLL